MGSSSNAVASVAAQRTWTDGEGVTRSGERCRGIVDGHHCTGYAYTPGGMCSSCAEPCDCGRYWPNCECEVAVDSSHA